MANSTISCLEVGSTIGASALGTKFCLTKEGDPNPKGCASTIATTTTTTSLMGLQEYRQQKILSEAFTYIESQSPEELEAALNKIEELELPSKENPSCEDAKIMIKI